MSLSLTEIVQNKICDEGPLSFHDFMEMALYHPQLGYYTSSKEKFGEGGDYITAPFFTNVYGKLIAKQLEEMWVQTGSNEFTIVEYGAGDGALCADILGHLKNNKQLYKHLQYCIIEKSETLRNRQRNHIASSAGTTQHVSWPDSIGEISPFTGCVLANEVLDNFSVHKVIMKENELMEIFVDHKNEFIEVLRPASGELKEYFRELAIRLPNDFYTEINLEAIHWLKNISASLKKGFVLTIDYGFPSSELYQSYRRLGTIVCYYKHSVNYSPYRNIGQQDITAHVNFSALERWGSKTGLMNCGFTTQSQFLSGLGLTELLRKFESAVKNNADLKNKLMQLHMLFISMGKKFKVLIQQKGLQKPKLSGLQFCHPLL